MKLNESIQESLFFHPKYARVQKSCKTSCTTTATLYVHNTPLRF
jgi:hypothetical protein